MNVPVIDGFNTVLKTANSYVTLPGIFLFFLVGCFMLLVFELVYYETNIF